MRCLARNPSYRPASAAELARQLAAASPEPPTQPLPRPSGVRATEVATLPLLRHTTAVAARPPEAPLRRGPALRREWLWFAVAAAAVLILIAVALANASGGNAPSAEPLVEPVPGGATPAQRARNLADWLRENSQ